MDVKLPNLGEGADSGVVVNILVNEGDQVDKDQTILELENEKAVAPIPAPKGGKVERLHVNVGDRIAVGQKILTLEEAEGKGAGREAPPKAEAPAQKSETPQTPQQESAAAAEPEPLPEPSQGGPPPAASPSIRKIARELGIDLRRVPGSERGGRIVMADLRAYIQRLIKLAEQSAQPSGQPAKAAKPVSELPDFSKWGEISKKPMSELRKVIARRMAESWSTIPHVTQFDEADITELNALRKKHSPSYKEKGGHLTVTVFALKAVVSALKQHPIFNASLDEASEEIIYKEYYHIGLAVDTDAGLMVPVIRDVDKKGVLDLALELSQFAEKTRDRKISGDEMKGGSFTISNQGGIGGTHFTPIVNKPEVAILGLGRGSMRPAMQDGKLQERLVMPVAVSYDHRVIDGGNAARFTQDFIHALQDFSEDQVRL